MARKRLTEAAAQAESDLKYWGYHVGKQFAADGYPEENPIMALLSGRSDLNPLAPRFGVNTKEIPEEAWRINAIVMRIPGFLRATLVGRYCLPVDWQTGRPIEARIIAEALHLSARTYFHRLQRARERYLVLSVSEPLQSLHSAIAKNQ